MDDPRPAPTCVACGSGRVGRLSRLREYLWKPEDPEDGGVWISSIPPAEGATWLERTVVGGREIGEMCAILCADCGRVDLYVKDSSDVPWNEDADFHELPPPSSCERCGSGRVGRMGTVGNRMPTVGSVQIEYPWYLFFLPRTVEPVGPITGVVCIDCGYLRTSVQAPDSVPWNRLEDHEPIPDQRCAVCDAPALGRLSRLGDWYACLAVSRARVIETPVGELRGVICSQCGYFEHYLRDVDGMPWESLIGFEWL